MGEQQGTIVRASRRFVTVAGEGAALHRGRLAGRDFDATVGDRVSYEVRNGEFLVTNIHERTNTLMRASESRVQACAANLDFLFIVSAVGALFNLEFLDRVMAVAGIEGIPFALVVNKTDLVKEEQKELLLYRGLGVEVFETSVKTEQGLAAINERLADKSLQIVALTGNSGVGKSSLLNYLIPTAARRTGEVSERTGQGKQTTSAAHGYPLERAQAPTLYVIDLPGTQNFGVVHLDERELQRGFPELEEKAAECEYSDCRHDKEPDCAVRDAVLRGEIATSRLDSFHAMLREIRNARPY